MELCKIVPGQIFKGGHTPELTAKMVEFTKGKPQERMRAINDGMKYMDYKNSPALQDAGMRIEVQ